MRAATRLLIGIGSVSLIIGGCGGSEAPSGAIASPSNNIGAPTAAMDVSDNTAARLALATRTSEIANPDDVTMVLLYHDLAGLALPIDGWVEEDMRVRSAPPLDKAANRAAVRAEFRSAAASVRTIGTLRLSMNANLSDYDPTYGEFTIRALAPSSEVQFSALRQKIAVRFANGRDAQAWQVPQAQAQAIRDKVGYGSASLDVLLRITGVRPAPGGGTIITDVIEYELRESRRGTLLGRVQVMH